MAEGIPVEDTTPISLEDTIAEKISYPGSEVSSDIVKKFERSKINRKETENRWLKSYLNFRGRYGEDVKFLDTEVSRVFIKITKTKTLAAYGQLLDVLLGGPQFPITVGPTEKPTDTVEAINIDPSSQNTEMEAGDPSTAPLDPIGYPGDGNDIQKGESLMDRMKRIAAASLNLGDKLPEVEEGGAKKPGNITLSPARLAGDAMTRKIQDQLTETRMPREFRKFLFELCMLGSGCLKGPFLSEKEYPKWTADGTYDPLFQTMPISKFASVWNIYNDTDSSSVEDSEWLIERHKLSAQELRAFKKQPYFLKDSIEEVLSRAANYRDESWELSLREGNDSRSSSKWEVLEYWGVMDTELLEDIPGLDIPKELVEEKEVNINAFVCDGILIRLVINPFKPSRIPYYVCPYEEDPYNFFGVGLPENMEDSQTLMNGFARMSVDNAVLAGSIMLEVDTDNLSSETTMDIYPGKIWKREGGQPGQTINSISFPNTANSNMMMYDKFRQLSDESTGISSFSHGQTGVSGVGRTAAGISMLMNAASGATKTVIKNIDDYVLEPMGKAYFAFNMQFDYDENIQGDLEVKPMGVSSLMMKEIKSQRLLQLIQVAASDPEMSARLNKEYITKELARSLELDPELTLVSPEEYQLKVAMGLVQPPAPPQQAPGGAPGGAVSPNDQVGGGNGNIGVGAPPMPGEEQFAGTPREGAVPNDNGGM